MARILGDESGKPHPAASQARALIVGGVRWTHAAARFWASLLNEVAGDYPDCTTLAFNTVSGTVLTRDLLFPETALQRELNRLEPAIPIEQALREALTEFEIFGPPGVVQLSLLAGNREIRRCQLPLDCVDADIFAYLLVWLMEWAELPESLWNSDRVEGAFTLRDPDRLESRNAANDCAHFEFAREHISEGLYRWRLTMSRQPAPDKANN